MVPATEKREVRVGIGKLDQPMTTLTRNSMEGFGLGLPTGR